MERAGDAVTRMTLEIAGGAYGRRAVVVCGKGNNGGDGLVAARLLDHQGMRVTVVALDEAALRSDLVGSQAARLGSETDVRVRTLDALARELARADVAVDAIFGTGFGGAVQGEAAQAIKVLDASAVPVVAVDIPSGVDGATGSVEGLAVHAAVTVVMGVLKPGVVLFPGAAHAGIVEVADIGIPPDLVHSNLSLVEFADIARLLPTRATQSHKRSSGVVLLVGGSRSMTGSIALAAQAAYRAGAGLVTVATAASAVPIVEASVTEAIYLPLPETGDGTIAEEAFEVLWDRLGDFDAFALGPGLSRNEASAEFARRVAAAVPAALVLDADGLGAFAGRASDLRDRAAADLVLTPHAGEFARLSGQEVSEVEADRVGSVRLLAAEVEATVLLKGPRTLIGSSGGAVRVNPTGSAALATAGSGDVLTGTIAAFLGRGLDGPDAAMAGAFVHGLAGMFAGETTGEGSTAHDVAMYLPGAIEEVRAL